MISLTWYSQCNSITGVWVAWCSSLCSSTGVFTTVRLCNRADSVLLFITDRSGWTIFKPAVLPVRDSFSLCVTYESDSLSFEHLIIWLYRHHSFWSLCGKIIIDPQWKTFLLLFSCPKCWTDTLLMKHLQCSYQSNFVKNNIFITTIFITTNSDSNTNCFDAV